MSIYLNESKFLEGFNAFLFVLSAGAFLQFLRYMYLKRAEGYVYLRPAIALLMVWLGSTIVRGDVWWTRHLINNGQPTALHTWNLILGGSLLGAGILCSIRVFSSDECGDRAWIITLICAIIATVWTLT